MTRYKAQVNAEGHEFAMPGWHTYKTGSQEECEAAQRQYLATGGKAKARIVPANKRDDEE